MKFREKDSTPGVYRQRFLDCVGDLMPEVLETLKSLVPQYEKVFGAFGYGERIHLFVCLVANKTTEGNYILCYLDPSVQNSKPDAPEPSPEENPILKNFLEFQQSFYEFIARFYLEKDWLKSNLFRFLYELSTNPKKCGGLGMAGGYDYSVYSGEPLEFTFDGWEIRKDSKDFEKAAVSAFKDYLRGYTQKTAKQAKADGYVSTQGRGNDFERLRWLVVWNNRKTDNLWEIFESFKDYEEINEFKEIDVEKAEQRETGADKLRKAFREFEAYDLPVRAFGNHRN